MAEAAARPEAGEKLAFLVDRLKEEEGKDFPRVIPKEAKAKAREGDIESERAKLNFSKSENTSTRSKDFCFKVLVN